MHYWGVALEELLDRYFASDDEQAMAELVRLTRPRLLAVARRISREDAEDAVQAAYLSLAKRGGLGGVPVLPWLLTAVSRIAYRAKATRAREHAIAERLAPAAAPPEPPEIAIGGEEAELLRRELWKLPPDYRDALQLRYLHGLSGAETARLLGINDSTLRTRLQRGRLMLRSRLGRVLFVLPWLFRDAPAAAVSKLAIAAVLLAGVLYVSTRESTSAPRAAAGREVALPAAAEANEPAALAAGIVVDEAGAPLEGVRLIVRAVEPDVTWKEISASFRGRATDPSRAPRDRIWPQRLDDAFRARAPLATTDAAGRFAVRRALGPRETLVFVKEGHSAYEATALDPDMRVVLPSVPSLAGRVTDTSGSPIAHATVQILDRPWQDAETDEEGRYSFPCPPSQVRNMVAWADGYDYVRRGLSDDFCLPRCWLVVDVTDAGTGKPLANACARLASDDGRPFPGASAAPGDRVRLPPGRCLVGVWEIFRRGEAGEAVVHAFAFGYQPAFEPVALRQGQEPPHLRVALKPGDGPPSLAGRVTGAPVAHIVLKNPQLLMREDFEYVTEADTEPGGRFVFSGLPRADYVLIVTAPGMGTVTRRLAPKAEDIEIALEPAAVLEVLARDRRGAAVAGTAIHVELPDGNRHWIVDTDDRGWAVFDALPAEELLVVAVGEGWNRQIHGKEAPAVEVTPVAGARTQLTVTAPEPLAAVVRVKDDAQAPHAGVTLAFEYPFKGVVSVVGMTEYERLKTLRVTTDAAGEARVNLYPGEYPVLLVEGPTPARVAVLKVGEGEANLAECVVQRSPTVVRGRLLEYGSNRPLYDAVLLVSMPGETDVIATARTDKEGRFEIRRLPKKAYGLIHLLSRAPFAPAQCDFDLTQKDEVELNLFTVPEALASKGAEVAIAVRASTGALKGARVGVMAQVGDGWVGVGHGETDADGRLVLPALEAPRYRIAARAEGHEAAMATVDGKGLHTDVDIDLVPK